MRWGESPLLSDTKRRREIDDEQSSAIKFELKATTDIASRERGRKENRKSIARREKAQQCVGGIEAAKANKSAVGKCIQMSPRENHPSLPGAQRSAASEAHGAPRSGHRCRSSSWLPSSSSSASSSSRRWVAAQWPCDTFSLEFPESRRISIRRSIAGLEISRPQRHHPIELFMRSRLTFHRFLSSFHRRKQQNDTQPSSLSISRLDNSFLVPRF